MPRVLVVEDDPDIAGIVALALTRNGYQVENAADGLTALRMAGELRPDLVVLDSGLRGMEGGAVLRHVRDLSDLSGLPVLLLSALNQDADRIRGLRAGADACLTMPFTTGELLARVEVLLKRPRSPQWSRREYDDRLPRANPVPGIESDRAADYRDRPSDQVCARAERRVGAPAVMGSIYGLLGAVNLWLAISEPTAWQAAFALTLFAVGVWLWLQP
jgi:DNA-binding response OmpR family regulator